MAWLLSDRQVASHGGRDTSDCDLQRDVACRDAGRDLDVYLVDAGISGSDSGVLDVGRWEGHGAEGNGYGCRDGRGSWREDAWGVGRTGCAEAGHEDGKDVAGLGHDEGGTGIMLGVPMFAPMTAFRAATGFWPSAVCAKKKNSG